MTSAIGPMPGYAQSPGRPATVSASLDRDSQPSGGRLFGLRLPISGFAAASDGYGCAYALQMRPADHNRLTTAIEYRLAPRGPIGSFGLETSRDGPDIPLYELNSAAAMGPHGPETKVGARIAYTF